MKMRMSTGSLRRCSIAALVSLAGMAASAQDDSRVERCSKTFGTLAVAESQTGWGHIQRYGLGSPAALLRMMVQQSGCFDVVERGFAMRNLQQERALSQSGDLRQESNLG
jgi:curli biogenesis system outer membrane secretion channel CsgG